MPPLGSSPAYARPPAATPAAQTAPAADTPHAGARLFWSRLLLGMLLFIVFYLPNDAQIPLQTGIRGVNVLNLLFAASLYAMWQLDRFSHEPLPFKKPLILLVLMILWGGLVALVGDSTAWVEDVTYIKNAIFYPMLAVLFFHAVQDKGSMRQVILMMVFVTFTSSVLGMRQALDYGLGNYNEAKRVAAPFGWAIYDANRAAIFYCIYLQIAGAVALFYKGSRWIRVACAITFALGVFVVFHTYSRQSYFIMAVLLVVLALRRHLLVSAVVCVALLNYEWWVPESVIQRIVMTTVDDTQHPPRNPILRPTFDNPVVNSPIYNPGALYDSRDPWKPGGLVGQSSEEAVDDLNLDTSTESRLILWTGAWAMIQEHPLGIGLNRFQRQIGNYAPRSVAGKDAHNFYVLSAAEAGLIAPVVMLILLGSLLSLGFRLHAYRKDNEARTLSIAFTLATLAVMLGNIYGSRFLDGDVMGNYWILAGLTARLLVMKQGERAKRLQHEREVTAAQQAAQQLAWQHASHASRHAHAGRTAAGGSNLPQRPGYRAPSTRQPQAPVTSGKLPGSR